MTPDRRSILQVVAALLIVVVPILLMALNPPAPYVWLFSIEALLFLLAAAAVRRRGRLVLVNIGLILFILLSFEIVLMILAAREPKRRFEGTYTANYCDKDHPVLGYAPYPDNAVTSTEYSGDVWIYTVGYTIGPDALRVTPEATADAEDSVLFFGGSYTFGEGVEDEEALPYRVGVLTEGGYAVHNFALHGYGPHQMLSALERGYVDERIDHPPRDVIYAGASFHAARVRGALWDHNGPRYVIGDDGNVQWAGRFSDSKGKSSDIARWIRRRIEWSCLGREILARIAPSYREDRDLYLAVVNAARRRVEQEYPGCEFHVIFWDDPNDRIDYAQELQSLGIRVHRMTEIIPDVYEDRARYTVHELDGHPNPEALDRIARYVLGSILTESD